MNPGMGVIGVYVGVVWGITCLKYERKGIFPYDSPRIRNQRANLYTPARGDEITIVRGIAISAARGDCATSPSTIGHSEHSLFGII